MKIIQGLLQRVSGERTSKEAAEDALPLKGFSDGRVATPYVEQLSDEELASLNEVLPWRCFTVDSQGRRFGNRAWNGKRVAAQAVPDLRIVMMHEHFNLAGKHVLEIGCFEGVHTVALCQFAGRVTAVDSRIENVVKSIVRTAMFAQDARIFRCNVEDPDQFQQLPQVDFAHHVGVLYHLKDPVSHLLSLGKCIREGIMLDTHIATPDTAKHEYEIAGSTYKYRRHTESGIGEVFSGMYEHAKWLLLDDIKKTLGLAGFQEIKVVEVREERNGPRALLFARKAG